MYSRRHRQRIHRAVEQASRLNQAVSSVDVGWNPIRPIFHERSGSHEEHEEHKGKITKGDTRETLKPTRLGYTCARSSKHERRYKIHDQ